MRKSVTPSKTNMLPPDPVFRFKNDIGHVHSLCFSQLNTSQLIAGTERGNVHFWDLETNRLQHKQELGESIQVVHSLSNKLITQEKRGLVKLWSVNKSSIEELKKFEYYGGYCKSILIDNLLAIPQEDNIHLVDTNNFEVVNKFVPENEKLGQVMSLEKVTIGDNVCLMAGYETGDVFIWDLTASKPCGQQKLQEQITSLSFDSISRRGICGSSSSNLQIFSIDRSYEITLKCELSITNEGCNIVKLRPDNKILACGGWDSRLRLFSWKTLRMLVVLTEHKGAITDVQFSPSEIKNCNSKIMAVSGADGMVSLWNLYN